MNINLFYSVQLEFTARFYNDSFVPLILSVPRQVEYSIDLTSFTGIQTTLQGSVIAPQGVSQYTFQVSLPVGTLEATGVLLAGDFETFSCSCGP